MKTTVQNPTFRQHTLLQQYEVLLDQHMGELKQGIAEKTFEIKDFADMLHVHPNHLSNTLREAFGKSPCAIYEEKLLAAAKELLLNTPDTIAQIAHKLTYDPSNFTKFFKNYEGITPKAFRQRHINEATA